MNGIELLKFCDQFNNDLIKFKIRRMFDFGGSTNQTKRFLELIVHFFICSLKDRVELWLFFIENKEKQKETKTFQARCRVY